MNINKLRITKNTNGNLLKELKKRDKRIRLFVKKSKDEILKAMEKINSDPKKILAICEGLRR